MATPALRIIMGAQARAHIAQHGLSAHDISAVAAAAGGPKGLILNHLNRHIFGDFLPAKYETTNVAQPVHLIGASIGAWTMSMAASTNPVAKLAELARLYLECQRYGGKVTATDISENVMRILTALLAGETAHEITHNPLRPLHVLTVRGIPKKLLGLGHPTRGHLAGYLAAIASNAVSRDYLGRHLERVLFSSGTALPFFQNETISNQNIDKIPTRVCALTVDNLHAALAASGAIPLLIKPVQTIAGAPPGPYWDGGIIDYHLHYPYTQMNGVVLYPHFADYIVPGWLDKVFKGRRLSVEVAPWLGNVILLCPTAEWVKTLPNAKIPDRTDFKHFGDDWQAREAAWGRAISQSQQLGDEFGEWLGGVNG